MSFGEWWQLAVWNVKAALGDEDAKAHAQALRDVNRQATETDQQIFQAVESQDVEHEGLLGVLDDVGDGVRGIASGVAGIAGGAVKSFAFLGKNFSTILVIAIVAVVGYFVFQAVLIKKAVQ